MQIYFAIVIASYAQRKDDKENIAAEKNLHEKTSKL
jgi:hypothetical protein